MIIGNKFQNLSLLRAPEFINLTLSFGKYVIETSGLEISSDQGNSRNGIGRAVHPSLER
ncbi:MAG: hypothetical protein LBC46_01170 [Treponema sp.]|nr:hypothetical protein [Treponema sp.]